MQNGKYKQWKQDDGGENKEVSITSNSQCLTFCN